MKSLLSCLMILTLFGVSCNNVPDNKSAFKNTFYLKCDNEYIDIYYSSKIEEPCPECRGILFKSVGEDKYCIFCKDCKYKRLIKEFTEDCKTITVNEKGELVWK